MLGKAAVLKGYELTTFPNLCRKECLTLGVHSTSSII